MHAKHLHAKHLLAKRFYVCCFVWAFATGLLPGIWDTVHLQMIIGIFCRKVVHKNWRRGRRVHSHPAQNSIFCLCILLLGWSAPQNKTLDESVKKAEDNRKEVMMMNPE
jgi:hypothetical protein